MAKHQRHYAANNRDAAGALAPSLCEECPLFIAGYRTRARASEGATGRRRSRGEVPCWLDTAKDLSGALRFTAWIGLECAHETAQACWEQRDLITSIRIDNELRALCEQMRDEWRG